MREMAIALALLALLLPAVARASGDGWHADYDEAMAVAKKEGKDLLVDWTGSDWCGWCKKLDAEVFSHAEFMDYVKEHYVLLALDFPRSEEVKAKVPNPARNQELMQKYGVKGYPTIHLMDSDGNVYAQTGYQPGGPVAYVDHLKQLREKFRPGLARAIAASEAVASAKGADRVAAVESCLAIMEELKGALYLAALLPGAKAALEIDPDNAKGLKMKAIAAVVDSGQADEDVLAAAESADPKNESGLLEKALVLRMSRVGSEEGIAPVMPKVDAYLATGKIHDKDAAIQIRANAAFWCFKFLNQPEKAKEHAQALKEMAPDNPRLMGLVKMILGE